MKEGGGCLAVATFSSSSFASSLFASISLDCSSNFTSTLFEPLDSIFILGLFFVFLFSAEIA